MKRTLTTTILLAILALPAGAQDFGKGEKAAKRGDYAAAVKEWRPLAEQGHARAQYDLGLMYANGLGVPQDDALALKWFRKAAERGNMWAQYNLASMYEEGRLDRPDYAETVKWYRIQPDPTEAVKWYRKSAEQGNSWAQYNLGVMYEEGLVFPPNHAEAVKWYRIAAEHGHPWAQLYLGGMYEKGDGVPQDYAEAEKWYRKAAELGAALALGDQRDDSDQGLAFPLGHTEAAKLSAPLAVDSLGAMYEEGRGVQQDYVQAHMWYNLATALGNEEGSKHRDVVEEKMTPAEIAKAQRLAREWMAKHRKK